MQRRAVEIDGGIALAYGHYGRPVVAFPSENGQANDWEERGMVEALGDLIDGGRIKLYCVPSYDSESWTRRDLPLEERARRHGHYEWWILSRLVPFVQADSSTHELIATGCSFGAYHAANFCLKRADLFPVAIGMSGVYDVAVQGGGERGDAVYFSNPMDYVGASPRRPSRLAARPGVAGARLRTGPVGGHDRGARLDEAVRGAARTRRASATSSTCGVTTCRTTGRHGAARSRIICPVLSDASEATIGLLLGTEEDWPAAFEALVGRLGPVDGTTLRTARILNEPFDLRYRPQYALVIDRLAWWYDLPRAWLKKIALMDDVYLLNNPFTFQAMEKHSAYCALMRLGIRVPETWLIPHKVPPVNARFQETAERYNAPFDLEAIGAEIGYPLFMKPFDGGQWIGVSRVGSPEELRANYDDSGQRMMHLQTALEDFDVFVRSLSIGAETMSMWFDPGKPMYDRYQVRHDFLSPELGDEIVSISRLVNAFFRWEFNSCETIVKDGIAYPIDYANASPDVALTSLHYYFPWAIKALVRWSAFCAVTRRPMLVNQNSRDYFQHGDRDDLSYEEKLAKYRELADDYFQIDAYHEFCDTHLGHLDELAHDWFTSARVRRRARRRRSRRRSRRTSTSTSSPTTAACWPRGRPTTLDGARARRCRNVSRHLRSSKGRIVRRP